MKRFLIFGISSQLGGVETFILNYVEKLKEESKEYKFDFVVFDKVPKFIKSTHLSEDIFYIIPNRVKNPVGYYLGLKAILTNKKYDVLWYNACTLSDITLLKIAKKDKIPCRIIHSHNSENMGGKIVGLLHGLHKKEIDKVATHFFACSVEAGKYMFPEKICKEKMRIIKNAIIVENYQYNATVRTNKRKELGVNEELLIGNIGRFHFQKNHDLLINIFEKVLKKNVSSKLVLIGNGELKDRIVKKTEMMGIRDKVIFLEDRKDINELLQAMDIFLMPSLFEGLPFALVEAQAADLPCVISDTISQEALIIDNIIQVGLNEKPDVWADIILKIGQKRNRKSQLELFREKGFDISYNSKQIIEYLK